mmetsp:Transcript_6285/g.6535  ORF Transcript_6285/g.6535 Transcript_6285/m.6535 type:complete len:261 (+) Transcript_6285:28-810(+)
MFFSQELTENKTYWFTNSHSAVYHLNLATLTSPNKSPSTNTILYLISKEKVLNLCSLSQKSPQQKLNVFVLLDSTIKEQNYGLYIESSNNSSVCLYGVYEYEESDVKYVPIRESNKKFTPKVNEHHEESGKEKRNDKPQYERLNLNEDKEKKEKDNRFKQKQNDEISINSEDRVYDDTKDESVSLGNLLQKKRNKDTDSKKTEKIRPLSSVSNSTIDTKSQSKKKKNKGKASNYQKSYSQGKGNNFTQNNHYKDKSNKGS